MTTLYIAGPMTGLPDLNRAAFNDAARRLVAEGFHVLNPARQALARPGLEWLDYMRAALVDISQADGLATLPGWPISRGARIEVELARNLGLEVRPVVHWLRTGAPR